MSLTTLTAATPHYLLLGNDGPIGPVLAPSGSEAFDTVLYGFSSKIYFDRFCAASDQTLRPYPLMKGHLNKPMESTGHRITHVVINADGPAETELHTATTEIVAHALENQLEQVPVEIHRSLSRD
ncbi:MAG: hypothetical protein HQ518_01045 [Rhodopirellula sp.]|nr:hypothetical protein [Rhodopirellula sp.]